MFEQPAGLLAGVHAKKIGRRGKRASPW